MGLVDECIKEVRTISYLLYPPMLEEMGLASAIPWYLEGFSKRCGIKTSFEITKGLERLPRDVELALFRVLQESLTNVQRHSGSPTVDIRIFQSGSSVALQVTDHGHGMPADVLAEGSADWMGSLGIGLRGMSERLRQLGGTLHISSTDTGTQVCATVPTDTGPAVSGGSAPDAIHRHATVKERGAFAMKTGIVIVDDHEVLREGVKALLAKSRPDLKVCGEAMDGVEAVEIAQTRQPDLLILDITMPRMSGLEAAARIRDLGLKVPVLIFTTHDSERLETEVRKAGAQGYVLKSQAGRDLVLAIDTILAGGSFFGAAGRPEPRADTQSL